MADESDSKLCEISWQKVHDIPTKCTLTDFLDSVQVWIDKPHVVNRRLSGSVLVKRAFLTHVCCEELARLVMCDSLTSTGVSDKIDEFASAMVEEDYSNNEEISSEVILRRLLPRLMGKSHRLIELVFIDKRNKEISFIPVCTEKPPDNTTNSNEGKCDVSDKSDMVAYKISWLDLSIEEHMRILLHIHESTIQSIAADSSVGDGVVSPSIKWLTEQLLPKLKKWAENPEKSSKGSLQLISLERYTILYQTLKEKYGFDLVKNWPENTDPQKFVFEDIAIATYLIVVWEAERQKNKLKEKQSFVDLGCGNGLLVYILTKEGYPGSGIDVRKRKIWEMYGPEIKLEENPLDPTAPGLFPKVDWLIGNHSDELTPWLPVIAARSSYKTRYFVLPCCFYDFNCKFVRKDNKVSQYRGYLDFVNQVGTSCGFEVEEDMLRIPSTKRICQIGQCRTYTEEEQQAMDDKIKGLIRERGCDIDQGQHPQTFCTFKTSHKPVSEEHRNSTESGKTDPCVLSDEVDEISEKTLMDIPSDGHKSVAEELDSPPRKRHATETTTTTSTAFQPREHKIEVRNCSHIGKPLKDFIVNSVVEALLGEGCCKTKEDCSAHSTVDSERLTSTGTPVGMWNEGGSLPLPEVAKLFDKDTLKKLKNECGGIQTLLRNHRYIFQVVGGVVQLRDWRQEIPGPKLTNGDHNTKRKRYEALRNTSLCWFHFSHPDGCVLSTEQCPYAHSDAELVDRPSKEHLNDL